MSSSLLQERPKGTVRMSSHPVQVIAVTGGKGGVGKSNVSVNLSMALADMGRRVTLLDADLGLANIDVLLGIKSRGTLEQVIDGSLTLRDILVPGPMGIRVVPAASGTQSMVSLGPREHASVIQAFSDIADQMDVLVIDTAAGISSSVTSFVKAAQEVLLVVCDEPTSITDAYALLKLLNREHGMDRFKLVSSMTANKQQGALLFRKLVGVTDRFLDVTIEHVGNIPFDECVRKAVQKQKAVYEAYPSSKAAMGYRELAKQADSWPIANMPRGHLEFFVEQLVGQGIH
ncbi:MAG: flagellar biosynthesis protein FlhG [Cyclobacteriaceae bacterium]|jgi:flagellar biosynthesis protein FlhG